jgi:hypothetical protein
VLANICHLHIDIEPNGLTQQSNRGYDPVVLDHDRNEPITVELNDLLSRRLKWVQ